MCSQPIVHAAHEFRATPRAAARSSAASRRPPRSGRLEVARRQGVEAVEGEQVGDRPQLAVLLGRRAERARRESLGGRERPPAGRPTGTVRRRAHGHRLDALRPEHRAQAAPPGVAAVVAERGERDQPLAGRADRRDLPRRAEPLAQPVLGLGGREPQRSPAGIDPHAGPVAVDEETEARRTRRRRDRVDPGPLGGDGEMLTRTARRRAARSAGFATTANLAEVVSGVPTSGEKTKASGASGPSGSTPRGARRCMRYVPRPTPPT